jgi:hypothetical protein
MKNSGLRIVVGVLVCTVLTAVFALRAPARLITTPPASICEVLSASHTAAVKANDYVNAGVTSQAYAAHGCPYVEMPAALAVAQTKICKFGIKNIATFLNACPTMDSAYGTILLSTPILFDGNSVDPTTLATDIAAVCKNKTTLPQNGGPTLRQRQEFIVVQSLRTIYYMDSQGDVGCAYPWTQGRSLYKWMIAQEGGVDVRDDVTNSECCDLEAQRAKIIIKVPDPATEPNLDISPDNFAWQGISNQIGLITHETRHEPISPNPFYSFTHVGCCPAGANACDQTYSESNLTTYGTQYWLARAWLSGQINVGYGCAPDPNTTSYMTLLGTVYAARFCSGAPPAFTAPAKPGGTCPP